MPVRFYLTPNVNDPELGDGPKYLFPQGTLFDVHYRAMRYGLEPVWLAAANVTAAHHSTLTAQSDVLGTPVTLAQLDRNINPGQVAGVQAALELLNLPGNWVTTARTWREVLRVIASIFQLSQRFKGRHRKSFFEGGLNLNRTWGSLPSERRAELSTTFADFGWSQNWVDGDPLRVVLRNLAAQWGSAPFEFGESEL